ncbi:arsinothricin resistance N-acetyltransferase ArsN1 family B [Marinomonas dokdonensis]|uniref:arsinothricin resistance N-acetyltransferase ArsN1 family B n=1 Tax=Marinomonas dokdonensis TaxID=328224 RepID=UPI0040554B7E
MIRDVKDSDAPHIANIYNHYVKHSVATFEEQPVSEATLLERIKKVRQEKLPWLVLQHQDQLVGYAYASPWKERSAYRFAVEVSVYIDPDFHGQGLGKRLYQRLFKKLHDTDKRTAIAGITLPNPASVGLHESMGMTQVALFGQVGYKFDQWLDVGYWQVGLEE